MGPGLNKALLQLYSLCDDAYNSQHDHQKQNSSCYPEEDGHEICSDKNKTWEN